MDRCLSLLFVDDDDMVREGLRLLLERIPGVGHVSVAQNGRDALVKIEEVCPNVVITDICMPQVDGITLTREIRHRYPQVRVIILTGHPDEAYLASAFNAGAAAFILKNSDPCELEAAIRAAARDEAYVTPRIAKRMLTAHVITISSNGCRPQLTLRQRQTLQLVAQGKTSKEIAVCLNVTPKTVEKHRTDLMQRLGVSNATALVRYALDHHLV